MTFLHCKFFLKENSVRDYKRFMRNPNKFESLTQGETIVILGEITPNLRHKFIITLPKFQCQWHTENNIAKSIVKRTF